MCVRSVFRGGRIAFCLHATHDTCSYVHNTSRPVISYRRGEWSRIAIMSLQLKLCRAWGRKRATSPWSRWWCAVRWCCVVVVGGGEWEGGRSRAGARWAVARRTSPRTHAARCARPRWVSTDRAMEYQHQPIPPLGPPAPPPQLLPPAPPPPLPSLPQLQHPHSQEDDRWNQYHIWRQHVFVNGQSPPPAPAHFLAKERESARAPPNTGPNFSVDRELFVTVIWDFLLAPDNLRPPSRR